MRTLGRSESMRLRVAAAALFVVLAGGFALSGTVAVAASLPGRVGAPAATTPLVARAPAAQPLLRVAVVGDVGTGDADEQSTADRMAQVGRDDPFDALVLLGDNVYPNGDPGRLDATVFAPFAPILDTGARLLPVLGNHDAGFAAEQVAALGMPGRWYAVPLGGVLFIGLDSTMAEDPAQLRWLEETLAEAAGRRVIVAMHHPPFSAGAHGSDEDGREHFVPLFERYGVDLVLAGHDHDYQRSVPIGGATYVVSGAGAKVRATGAADFTAASAAVRHFVEVAVWADRIELRAVGLDGTFDHAVLTPDAPSAVTAAAFDTGGIFGDEPAAGVGLAALGAIAWIGVLLVGWLVPALAFGRGGRVLVIASTLSMLAVCTGVGLVTVSLVT